MLKRFLAASAAITLSSAAVPAAQADWWSFWKSWHIDRQRNTDWPKPFTAMDARSVQEPFDIMVANGWQLHHTLGDSLFSPNTGNLSAAGENKLADILRYSPPSRRVLFVKQAGSEELTAARVESVQLAISRLTPSGELPQLFVSTTEAPLNSGQYQTALNRALRDSMPMPRIPEASGGGGGGGGP
jgi:hypothetical protein